MANHEPLTAWTPQAKARRPAGRIRARRAMTWSPAEIADAVAAGLRARARADELEQAVYGFDALPELALHPILHASLREGGYGVWPEQRYPGGFSRRKLSEGKRCDVVLTP